MLAITTGILTVEVVGALVSGSLALLVGTGHPLTAAAGLLIALRCRHSSRSPTPTTKAPGTPYRSH